MSPTRTYIYYSDRKILEWRQQVPPSRWERATRRLEGVDVSIIGIGGVSVKLGPPPSEPVLQTLRAMWVDLADEGMIGTFDEPRAYVYGVLTFNYGLFDIVANPVLFLVGATDQTIVALGGSQTHVRGFRGAQIRAPENAQHALMESDVADFLHAAAQTGLPGPSADIPPRSPDEDIRAVHVAGLYANRQFWEGRKMEYEVLARAELRSSVSGQGVDEPTDVLIGSPVFVALSS